MLDLRNQLNGLAELLARSPALEAKLAHTLSELDAKARAVLQQECPFQSHLAALERAEQQQPIDLAVLRQWLQHHDELMALCGRPAKRPFWDAQSVRLQHHGGDPAPLGRLLLKEQRTALETAQARWQLARLSALRAEYLAQLQSWLEALQALSRRYRSLGLDPGILVDLCDGEALTQAEDTLNRWADYLAGHPGIIELCRRIGRHRQPQTRTELRPVTCRVPCWTRQPNAPAPDDLFGVLPGRDLPALLPSELSQLSDPELASLFELKLLEGKLLAYQRRGWQAERQWRNETRMVPYQAERAKGPLVIAVDTSLSMQGIPEAAAKAIALTLAATARAEQRPVHLINFATRIEERDLAQHANGLIAFLQLSFHGGTDVALALEAALACLERPDYELADLVLISDMMLTDLSSEVLNQLNDARQQGHQIHAVAIGDVVRETTLTPALDCQWQFCPVRGDIALREGKAPAAVQDAPVWQGLEGLA
ncbi:VWA domain-containing protein [Marinobacter hydrocarbonoclasticus]|nr:VWA domain-containing protein [Marinobacter nauticus]